MNDLAITTFNVLMQQSVVEDQMNFICDLVSLRLGESMVLVDIALDFLNRQMTWTVNRKMVDFARPPHCDKIGTTNLFFSTTVDAHACAPALNGELNGNHV
jgi:hypothetical protein